jgi:hypothetical protein
LHFNFSKQQPTTSVILFPGGYHAVSRIYDSGLHHHLGGHFALFS